MLSKLLQAILDMMNHTHDAATGKRGFKALTGTGATTGSFYAIVAVNGDATLNAAGTLSKEGDTVVASHIIPNGYTLYGNWSSVQLSAGTAYLYHD